MGQTHISLVLSNLQPDIIGVRGTQFPPELLKEYVSNGVRRWEKRPSLEAGFMPAVKKLSVPFSSLFTILNIKF